MRDAEAQLSFINVSEKLAEEGFNAADSPFGIDCGDPDFVYITIFNQGLLARINKTTRVVEDIINDPETGLAAENQNFYSIARDPNTGNFFINEVNNAKLWRFDPSEPDPTLAWDKTALLPAIIHPNVTYPFTYLGRPTVLEIDETFATGFIVQTGFFIPMTGGVVYANNFVWVTLTASLDLDPVANSIGLNDEIFSGLVRVDPITLDTERFNITDSDGNLAGRLASLNVDFIDPSIIWVADKEKSKVYKFDTNINQVLQTVDLPSDSFPNHIDSDENNIFVALNKPPQIDPDTEEIVPSNSTILQFSRENTAQQLIIDTGAPIEESSTGTFTVFVNNDLLVWTDGSAHVGIIDLSSGIPVPVIDPDTGLSFLTTETTIGNHFGCVPVDGEFWFAGRGSAFVGILPNSKFIGGRPVRATSTGGGGAGMFRGRDYVFGDPEDPRYDSNPPVIEEVLIQQGSIKIFAKITDTVGVKDANVIVGKIIFPMSRHAGSMSWWYRIFTADDLPSTGEVLLFTIVASDFNNNKAEHSVTLKVPVGALSTVPHTSSFVIAPFSAGGERIDQRYSIVTGGEIQDNQNISPWIMIKNIGTEPLQNIRLVLSPELKGKFLLSDYAIKSIAPQSEYTVSLKLNGKPTVDAMNNPIPYRGSVIVSVDNHTPYILQLSGEIPNESASLQSLFMKMISNKVEQRYKTFEKPDLRISQEANYKITLGSGENTIKGADELIITNTGDKPLKNLRILTSSSSDHIIPEQKNIDLLPAGSFIKVKLVSKMNDAGSAKDLLGEVIVAPENGTPVSVPINIGKRLMQDKNEMYEVTITSGGNSITHTSDSMVIRNNSEDPIDNVRIILPQQLARVFSMSKDSFKSIEPNTEETIYLRQRGTINSNAKQILNDYRGDIIIVSSNGMKKVIPINIVWKGISSEHFVLNAKDNAEELAKAAQVINFLERSYAESAELLGETSTKTVIYMTSSLDEVSQLSDALAPSAYFYDEDVALVWSNSEDVNMLALKEFAYTVILQNYGTYWAKQKITLDKGNWLVDGISNYVTSTIVGERGIVKEQLEAFVEEPVSFEWYGASTPSKHGASYTLFKFLANKYSEAIVDRVLNNLGSTMVSNSRCGTMEQCAILKAVYDENGLNANGNRHDVNFATIIEEWKDYVQEHYLIKQ